MEKRDVETAAPRTCPFCRSAEIATTRKAAVGDQYWRCRACGQIWSPARPPTSKRWS